MPLYEYKCECGNEFDQFFKTLPSEAKQKSFPCPECDKPAQRLLGSFMVGQTQSGEIEKSVAMSMQKADIGGRMRPVFRDENGRMHEVKSMFDVSRWKKHNQLGKPRMIEWHNPVTGEKSWVPERVKMVADPISGEPLDAPVKRESVDLVELDHFEMPTETKSGRLDPRTGTLPKRDLSSVRIPGTGAVVDPETGKPMTMGSVWGDKTGPSGTRDNAKARLAGKRMTQQEAVQRLASEI